MGWSCALLCASTCNTTGKATEGQQTEGLASVSTLAALVATSNDEPTVSLAAAAKADPRASFLGMWTTTAASAQTNCGGNVSDVLGTTITWSAGSYSGHIQAELVGKCILDAKVNGNTATAADQTCNDNGITYVVGGTFVLQPDGSARLNEHARVTGKGVNCTATLVGPFQKYVP